MSEYFTDCVDRGGKVRTETISGTEYRATCSIDGNTYYGETFTKKTDKQKRRAGLTKKVTNENKRSSLKGS